MKHNSAMRRTTCVIVSKWNNKANRIVGDRLFDKTYSSLTDALAIASQKVAKGMSVIVRPDYNERDEKGTFFREWRSFDGEPLKELRFDVSSLCP